MSQSLALFLPLLLTLSICAELGPSSESVQDIGGKSLRITTHDVEFTPDDDFVRIEGKKYNFGPTWTILGTRDETFYIEREYEFLAACQEKEPLGCNTQKPHSCRYQPVEGEECWLFEKNNIFYCFTSSIKLSTTRKAFSLQELVTFSLFDYGGPGISNEGVLGWTLKSAKTQIDYDYNAAIFRLETDSGTQLNELRLVEEHKILTKEAALELSQHPTNVSYDPGQATCNQNTHQSPLLVTRKDAKPKTNPPFKAIYITRKAQVQTLSTLEEKVIINYRGEPVTWPKGSNIEIPIADPCQQKFYYLTKDHDGYYIVKPFARFSLDEGAPLCVMISDRGDLDDLVVYELNTNHSKSWRASNFFGVLVLNSYHKYINVRVTSTSNIIFGVDGPAMVKVFLETFDGKVSLKGLTAESLDCVFYIFVLCPDLHYKTTAWETFSIPIADNCLKSGLRTRGNFNCHGIIGDIMIPNAYSSVPLERNIEIETRSEEAKPYYNDKKNSKGNVVGGGLWDSLKQAFGAIIDLVVGVASFIKSFIHFLPTLLLIIAGIFVAFIIFRLVGVLKKTKMPFSFNINKDHNRMLETEEKELQEDKEDTK